MVIERDATLLPDPVVDRVAGLLKTGGDGALGAETAGTAAADEEGAARPLLR